MSKKQNAIAEQLLQMENKKYALLEQSSSNYPDVGDTSELDKLNMSFFGTLLPPLREVGKQDILLCKNNVSPVVFSDAYIGAAWKSLN